MRLLVRNKTDFEYLPYTGEETDLNDDGEHTGEFHPVYGTAVPYRGNISTPSGQTNQTFYGTDIRYTHTLVMDDPNVEIDEYGLIRWKGHLYEVKAARPSLNGFSAALKRITEDHQPEPEPTPTPEPGPDNPDDPVDPDEPVNPDDPDTPVDPDDPDEPTEDDPDEPGGDG